MLNLMGDLGIYQDNELVKERPARLRTANRELGLNKITMGYFE